jgi:YfiH family protein
MKPFTHSFQKNSLSKHPGLVHAFSPRNHERKDGTTGELNFASGSRSMRANVQWFLQSIGMNKEEVFLVRQVHGNVVYDLKDASASSSQVADVPADAIITRLAGKPIGVLTADCIPVVVYDSRLQVTGVIHAGRKGTALGIVSKTIQTMQKLYGSNPQDILVEMGPGIGGCCYEVDQDCIEPFKKLYSDWTKIAKPSSSDKFMLDLFSANAEDAKMAEIEPGNISHTGICTSCQVKRFFSYRREGTTGRMLTVAMLNPE